jgi:hypothetical protein
MGSANVNGLLMAGTVATWLLARRGHDRAAGALIAVMAAVKIWPAFLMVWFVAQRRWGSIGGFLIAGLLLAAGSLVGAGLAAHVEYVAIAGSIHPSEFSIAGLLAGLGLSLPWVGYAVAALVAIAIFRWRSRPSATFSLAVATIVLASPVLYVNGYAMLLAALAPLAWTLTPVVRRATVAVAFQPAV